MSLTPFVNSTSFDPSLVIVTLPPGLTLEQFQHKERTMVTLAITHAVAFGILLWDYLLLLPDEIQLYGMSSWDMWGGPAVWSFLVLRYSGFIFALPALFFTAIRIDHCQTAVAISQLGNVLINMSSGIIFGYRVSALWGGHKAINIVVGFMYLFMITSWIAVVSQYRAVNGPPELVTSNCEILPIVPWAPLCYASSFAFNTLILLLTIWKIPDHRHTKSPVAYLIFRDSLLYFFFTTVMLLAVLSIQSLGPDMADIKPTAIPFAAVITTIMGSRLFLNLRLLHQRREADDIISRDHIASRMSPTKSLSIDDHEQVFNLRPALPSASNGSLVDQVKHSPNMPGRRQASGASTYSSRHERDRSVDSYVRHKLPSSPPGQSIPQDIGTPVNPDKQEHHALLENYYPQNDGSAV